MSHCFNPQIDFTHISFEKVRWSCSGRTAKQLFHKCKHPAPEAVRMFALGLLHILSAGPVIRIFPVALLSTDSETRSWSAQREYCGLRRVGRGLNLMWIALSYSSLEQAKILCIGTLCEKSGLP